MSKQTIRNEAMRIGGEKIFTDETVDVTYPYTCLLYTSPSPRDYAASRMPSSA